MQVEGYAGELSSRERERKPREWPPLVPHRPLSTGIFSKDFERSSTGKSLLASPMVGIMMSFMRITLTIDLDVERLLQHEIRRTDKCLKAVLNYALRLGLGV